MIDQLTADQLTEDFIKLLQDKKFYQAEAAKEYCKLLHYSHFPFDWGKLNQAIINKWSMAGLIKVKEMAWKLLHEGE